MKSAIIGFVFLGLALLTLPCPIVACIFGGIACYLFQPAKPRRR